ncbi:hypothetical protein [Streptomyces sp. H27-D2]|uniref:hypothetical protein n=1 Tax=Streptomyces sp. H27-D2 TaxID=3046304 RepID=UPI002DB9448F|nr:hypothetical protein [Streptomyces sp. H27-D2]MEC4019362.1 hypothetical protein [Streptomyces sp. H27-D2]
MSGNPEVGTLAHDVKRDRVGKVMDTHGNRVFLRPVNGGVEWEAAPDDLEPADTAAELRAKAAEANARSRDRA